MVRKTVRKKKKTLENPYISFVELQELEMRWADTSNVESKILQVEMLVKIILTLKENWEYGKC